MTSRGRGYMIDLYFQGCHAAWPHSAVLGAPVAPGTEQTRLFGAAGRHGVRMIRFEDSQLSTIVYAGIVSALQLCAEDTPLAHAMRQYVLSRRRIIRTEYAAHLAAPKRPVRHSDGVQRRAHLPA